MLQTSTAHEITSFGKECYYNGIFKFVKWWDNCLNANGDYMEK
jgi:hypothetical protein